LERRQMDQLAHLGMDEKSFKRGHSYITLLTDLDQSRVLAVAMKSCRPMERPKFIVGCTEF